MRTVAIHCGRLGVMVMIAWSMRTNIVGATSDLKPDSEDCEGWYLSNGFCYKVFNKVKYYKDAESYCRMKNAHLASITSGDDNKFVHSLVEKFTIYNEAWIGYKRPSTTSLFVWLDNTESSYENWLVQIPRDTGSCVEMTNGGYWINIMCYRRMPFVCKRAKVKPAIGSNLALILNISIPLSCVFVMCVFVGFLCYRSCKELSDIKVDSIDEKPFTIIRAALILPIKKAPDLLNNNKSKNLWKGAIEKLRREQSQNNPLNDPSTFLKRACSNDEMNNNNNNNDDNNNNNNNNDDDNNNNNNNNKSIKNKQDGLTLADMVNSLLQKRRETNNNGMLGAPNFKNHVPSISIRSPSVDSELMNEPKENARKSDLTNLHSESSFSQTHKSEVMENHTCPVVHKSATDIHLINKQKNRQSIERNVTFPNKSTEDRSPIFKNKYAHTNDECGIQSKTITFIKDDNSCFDQSEFDSDSSIESVEQSLRDGSWRQKEKKDTAEVVVVKINKSSFAKGENNNQINDVFKPHLSSEHNHSNLIQRESPPSSSPPSCHNKHYNGLPRERNNNSVDWDDDDEGCSDGLPISPSSDCSSTTTTPIKDDGVFDRNTFRDSIRKESEKRKERYFPSTSSSSERNFDNIALPPLIKQNQYTADYTRVTLV